MKKQKSKGESNVLPRPGDFPAFLNQIPTEFLREKMRRLEGKTGPYCCESEGQFSEQGRCNSVCNSG